MSKFKVLFAGLGVIATSAALTACVDNNATTSSDGTTAAGDAITVSSTADACEVATNTTASGTTTFEIANDGDKTTEFYLLGADGLRIVSEKENIAPGQKASMTVSLQPGEYFTACKPGMRGANVGQTAFTVTGDPIELSGEDQELFDAAVQSYVNFAKNEVEELVPGVEKFAKAYVDGDDETARKEYAKVRINYERIEPIAEALGILDPRIDYREIDYLAEADLFKEDDPTFDQWLGFHRIEKDLWVPKKDKLQPDGTSAYEDWKPSDKATRKKIGDTLVKDVNKLYDEIHSDNFIEEQQLNIASVSNGAAALLEDIAVNKITGEENWWSGYDLWDFQANLEGSRIAFDLVAPIVEPKSDEGKKLVAEIEKAFDDLQAELEKYGNYEDGFKLYDEVSEKERKELTAKLDAVREPLAKLTDLTLK